MSSCSTTFWDPHWDPRLRRLIPDTFQPHYEDFAHRRLVAFTMTAAFEQDACTTLEDAKRLITRESACLRSFNVEQREIFLGKLAAADVKGVIQPFAPFTDGIRDMPPPESRMIYLIMHDAQVLQADPLRELAGSILKHRLPLAAVDRFLGLVGSYDVPKGMHASLSREGGVDCSVPATFDSALYDCVHHDAIGDANYVLHGALWGADCNSLHAASKLSMYSECLKYIPEDVREQFLSLVADAVVATTIAAEIAAQQAAAEYEASWTCKLHRLKVAARALMCSSLHHHDSDDDSSCNNNSSSDSNTPLIHTTDKKAV
eukprot:4213-Heterococcus_DN1.PRE.2